ncbi:MAG: hypothetical protein CMI54_02955 [Parcubacteria group bacterium]|nr:hypothetical protein [Parcubacteria group bacterium]|tara:strand:- start:19098 stop:19658 length:561 start_codon:yes stop_codon:yes gene_type:complete
MLKPDPVEQAMSDGATTIDLAKDRSIAQTILGQPLHQYFSKAVKEPFLRAVIFYSKKYPHPTRKNVGQWAIPFMDALDKLVAFNRGTREDFFIAVRRIVLGTIAHDGFYRERILAMFEWLIESLLNGKIYPRGEGTPKSNHWTEPQPYGGKHSIISKILIHRNEINKILGRSSNGDTNTVYDNHGF